MSDNLYLFPKTRGTREEQKPAEWRPTIEVGGKRSASIICPLCTQRSYLDHDIAADGTVTPSIVCPAEGCTFHVMGKLLDWEP